MVSYHSLSKNVSLVTVVEDKLQSHLGYAKSAVSTCTNTRELRPWSILWVLKGKFFFPTLVQL